MTSKPDPNDGLDEMAKTDPLIRETLELLDDPDFREVAEPEPKTYTEAEKAQIIKEWDDSRRGHR